LPDAIEEPKNRRTAEFDAGFMQSTETAHLTNESMEREDRLDKLEECMEQLPLEQKHSIQLFFIQKKCYNEIAEITGQEWNKVRSYIQNGKRNLKICMEAKGIVNS
jgi:RNA polymerase sigma-70 factor (ECF subfamily)